MKQVKSKSSKRQSPVSVAALRLSCIKTATETVQSRLGGYLMRRPHRSFRRTRRRDYVRSLSLPGYWKFSYEVISVIWKHKRLFLTLLAVYAVISAVFIGLSSQTTYDQLSTTLKDTGSTILSGNWGEIGKAGLLTLSGFMGSLSPRLTDVQQVYGGLLLLITWLTTVWLLRDILAGHQPRLKDAIYSSGSPIIATAIVLLILLVQLIPGALAIISVSAGAATGILSGGLLAMLVWLIVGLLVVLSLYWITSTIMALVIVTLPGMYPWQAIRTAGDLVVGRRMRLLLRLTWHGLGAAILWITFVLLFVLFDGALKSLVPALQWLPLVPIIILFVSSFITIWSACYIYLLYRKAVEDDASPA